MTTRTELLNFLATRYNLTRYLEIGVQNPENNFNKIICEDKLSVDPDPNAKADQKRTSDDFFAYTQMHILINPPGTFKFYDLIFIDGLHHADQAKRDFENALQVLSPNGFIVLHDCNPPEEQFTHVPRDTKIWYGDVYKLAVTISDRMKTTVDIDCGCCVIWPRNLNILFSTTPETKNISWDHFNANRKTLLNLISSEDFIKLHS